MTTNSTCRTPKFKTTMWWFSILFIIIMIGDQEQETPECSICQDLINEDNNDITTPCGHSFHINCLLEWCRRHNLATTCPLCREPIPDICADLLPNIAPDVETELIQLPFPDIPDNPDIVTTTNDETNDC